MHVKYFRLAKQASMRSEHKFKVGACVVVGKNAYIGWSHGTKTHSKSNQEYKSIHAEFHAILKALSKEPDLRKASMYVYRTIRSDNGRGLAKPCKQCLDLINENGIKHIYFSAPDGFHGIVEM